MKKALVKYKFPFWKVLVYNNYTADYVLYVRPENFFRKSKAIALAKKIRFND